MGVSPSPHTSEISVQSGFRKANIYLTHIALCAMTGLLVGILAAEHMGRNNQSLGRPSSIDLDGRGVVRLLGVETQNVVDESGLMALGGGGVLVVDAAYQIRHKIFPRMALERESGSLDFLSADRYANGHTLFFTGKESNPFLGVDGYVGYLVAQFRLSLRRVLEVVIERHRQPIHVHRDTSSYGVSDVSGYAEYLPVRIALLVKGERPRGGDTSFHPWSVQQFKLLLSRLRGGFSGLSSLFGGTHLASVNDQQAQGNQDSATFERPLPPFLFWISALTGAVGVFWGWGRIRSDRGNRFWNSIAFIVGCILWIYGFAGLITL